jgi:hypothetical protein
MSKFIGGNEEAEAILRLMKNARDIDENPWLRLPVGPPYVLPEDQEAIDKFNAKLDPKHKHYLHIDKFLPEPFVGSKDAPVVLLSNNPGFNPDPTRLRRRQDEQLQEMMRNNLHHAVTDWPFVFLHPAFDDWEKWWRRKRVRRLIKRFDQRTVARCILNVVLCPYPSRNYRHLAVSSQRYSFGLVRDAVARNAVIILMRPGQKEEWEKNVPKLQGYSRFYSVRNPQNPAITENCPGYEQVVLAIEAFTNGKQGNEVK